MMRRVLIVAAVFGTIAVSANGAAAAAFCAYAGGPAGYENCGYHTFEQCMAGAAGRGRACMRNPHDPAAWGLGAAPPSSRHHHRHRRPAGDTHY